MLTRRANIIETLLVLVAVVAICTWSSIYRDNNFVTVRVTAVPIVGLPPQFEGYRILLITDLHGKEFGAGQKRLRQALENASYDAVALTGDYVDKARSDVTPLADLLDALSPDVPVAYVLGNSDLWSPPDPTHEHASLVESVLAEHGSAVTSHPVRVDQGGATLVMCATAYTDEQTAALQIVESADVRIALSHSQPATLDVNRSRSEYERMVRSAADDPNHIGTFDNPTVFVDFDLVLAGHTHGGQVRLPFVGAIWAPGLGYWPQDDLVEGLHQGFGRSQFVGAGLGSTSVEGFFGGSEGERSGIAGILMGPLEWALSRRVCNPARLDVLVLQAADR